VLIARVQEDIYSLIGDAGPVTPDQLGALLGERDVPMTSWLRSQEAAGYLYRDEFGTYGTSCPWPRIGF